MNVRWLVILLLVLCSCKETILHDVTEVHANRIKVALAQEGIDSQKSRSGNAWNIVVDAEEATRALTVLEKSRVVRPGPTLKASNSSSLVQSKEEREYDIERKLAWTIEQTLERLPYVLEARVHLNLRSQSTLPTIRSKEKETASVLLVSDKKELIDTGAVRKLVSGASGVAAASVSVLTERAVPKLELEIPPAPKKEPFELAVPAEIIFPLAGGMILLMLLIARAKRDKRKLAPASEHRKTEQLLNGVQLTEGELR